MCICIRMCMATSRFELILSEPLLSKSTNLVS